MLLYVKKFFKKWITNNRQWMYNLTTWVMLPVLWAFYPFLKNRFIPGSVLHVCGPSHVVGRIVDSLRRQNKKVDYLVIGANQYCSKFDHQIFPSFWPFINVIQEIAIFLSVISRYEIIHSHFANMPSYGLWEIRLLKALGRKLVFHYRGCEIRDREKNMLLHPKMNICQECDYNAYNCKSPRAKLRARISQKFADATLVTTPDMKDFVPDAIHIPFTAPDWIPLQVNVKLYDGIRPFKIVHVTGHPGIEGTHYIEQTINRLKEKGFNIQWVFLNHVKNEVVHQELQDADLAIGKMKMGYYANAQIEAMVMGVPTVTYIRDEFVTDAIKNSGLIISSLDKLEETLEYYLKNPTELEAKRKVARSSILNLHDEVKIAKQYISIYEKVLEKN